MGQPQPLFAYFRPFLKAMTNVEEKLTLKHRWFALDSNPGNARW